MGVDLSANLEIATSSTFHALLPIYCTIMEITYERSNNALS